MYCIIHYVYVIIFSAPFHKDLLEDQNIRCRSSSPKHQNSLFWPTQSLIKCRLPLRTQAPWLKKKCWVCSCQAPPWKLVCQSCLAEATQDKIVINTDIVPIIKQSVQDCIKDLRELTSQAMPGASHQTVKETVKEGIHSEWPLQRIRGCMSHGVQLQLSWTICSDHQGCHPMGRSHAGTHIGQEIFSPPKKFQWHLSL